MTPQRSDWWRRAVSRAAAVLAGVGAVLALSASPASAAYAYRYQGHLIGFSDAYSTAVDGVSGDPLVADSGPDVIDVFGSSGGQVATWNGSAGTNAPGTPSGSFGFGQVTVAANDTTGNVYVTDSSDGVVDVLSSTGGYLGQLSGVSMSSPQGIAVDQATGNVYVADPGQGVVDVFDSAGAFTGTLTGQGFANAFSVAVDDQSGTVLVADSGSGVVDVFDAATGAFQTSWNGSRTPAGSFGSSQVGVAADNATGDVFVTDSSHNVVDELDGSGNYLGQITGTPGGGFASAAGVSVDQASGAEYVSDIGKAAVDIFAQGALVPDLGVASQTSVQSASTTVTGTVNPDGVALTDCHFEYAATWTSAGAESVPCGPAANTIPADSNPHTVTANISGLQAGATYHFRLVAANTNGSNSSSYAGFTVPSAAAESCPNDQYRTGYAAALPDCRAYELVTPADAEPAMNTSNADYANPQSFQASTGGNAVGWFSWFNPADVPSNGHYFLSTRGAAGWSTVGVVPPQSPEYGNLCLPTMVFYSSDLSKGLLADGGNGCGSDDPPLVAGEPTGQQNVFVRDSLTGAYQLVDVTPTGVVPTRSACQQAALPLGCGMASPLAASSDLSHVVFAESAQLTPDSPGLGAINLFEWAGGVVRLVTYLPDGSPVQGSFPVTAGFNETGTNNPGANYRNGVSADGSHVAFTANGSLYVRENPMAPQSPISGGACTVASDACTAQLDAPQGGSGPGGGGQFMWASTDGSQWFFTDDASAGLTSDTVAGSGQNLYRYNLATNTLTDLTPDTEADVGGVAGAGDDGSYVYLEATGALTGAPNGQGASAQAGQPNLYVYHDGTTTFIAALAASAPATLRAEPADACDWTADCLTSRVSSDGRFIAFNSIESLTGYGNVPTNPSACDVHIPPQPSGAPCTEIYLYDAAAGELSCASCNPSGAVPSGPTWIRQPTVPSSLNGGFPPYLQRNLSDSGQVFFDSPDALVPQASNGQQNAYEYDNGQLSLLSSGTSSDPSYFFDASPSGNDVFIWTTQQLLPQAAGASASIYDARIDGGFRAPETPPPACSADACRTLSAAPAPPTGASVSFAGPGDVGGSPSGPAKVRVLARTVYGSSFVLQVSVPSAGRITVSGAGVRTVRRSVARAGTYKLMVNLAAGAARAIRGRGHGLKLKVRLGFAAVGGTAQTAMVSLTVERPLARHVARALPRAAGRTGDVR